MNTFDVSKRKVSTYEQFLKDRKKAEDAKHSEKGENDIVKKSMSGEKKGDKGIETLDESYYSALGGTSPLSDESMRTKIVEPALGKTYDAYIMFDAGTEYSKMKDKYANNTKDWKNLYRSDSGQGYAIISPDGKVIKASVLSSDGIIGAIYVKK